MLKLAATACLVINVGAGLLLAITRGGVLGQMGLTPPAPFYCDLMAVFLVASGVGFLPAVTGTPGQRVYLWVFGVGVKLVAASLLANLWLNGLVGWMIVVPALVDLALAAVVLAGLMSPARTARPA
jgi:hypothetical protein